MFLNVFRYLSGLQFIVYLLLHGLELMACSRKFEMSLKFKIIPRSENYDVRTSSQIDAASNDAALQTKKEKINNELKTRKVAECTYSFRSI